MEENFETQQIQFERLELRSPESISLEKKIKLLKKKRDEARAEERNSEERYQELMKKGEKQNR